MATRVPYCEEKDLLLGDMQVPRTVSKAEWIQSAADEMDAWIGQVYVIPIPLDPMDSAHQADILLLKKINQFLATGRIIIRPACPGHPVPSSGRCGRRDGTPASRPHARGAFRLRPCGAWQNGAAARPGIAGASRMRGR